MTLLSIIIPVYNAEKTIGRTLNSLNNIHPESKKRTQVVVIDDGSTDGSMIIVESIQEELSPLQLVLITQENQGSAAARNTGIEHGAGEWIFFLDADDELAFDPVSYIEGWPDHSALGFPVQWYKNGRPRRVIRPVFTDMENHLDVLTAANPFQPANFIIKRDRITSFFDKRFIYLEDWVFWFENPSIFEKVKIFRDTISAIIHVHGENKSTHYAMVGNYRERVASEMLTSIGDKLTKKQWNNLLIQAQIGRILQGKKIGRGNFLRFPCSTKLYGKLIIYSVLGSNFPKLDIYST